MLAGQPLDVGHQRRAVLVDQVLQRSRADDSHTVAVGRLLDQRYHQFQRIGGTGVDQISGGLPSGTAIARLTPRHLFAVIPAPLSKPLERPPRTSKILTAWSPRAIHAASLPTANRSSDQVGKLKTNSTYGIVGMCRRAA